MNTAASRAWRNRIFSLSAVVGYLALAHVFVRDPDLRSQLHYGLVISLGYGHLLGGVFFGWPSLAEKLATSRQRIATRTRGLCLARWLDKLTIGRRDTLWRLAASAGVALLFGIYSILLAESELLVLVLLAVATWHSIENDLALETTYARGLRRPPLPNTPEAHLSAFGITAYLLSLAGASLSDPEIAEPRSILALRGVAALSGVLLLLRARGTGAEWTGLGLILISSVAPHWLRGTGLMEFPDLFAASTLYHLFSWGGLSIQRCRSAGAPRHMARHLLAIHSLPVLILLFSYSSPDIPGRAMRVSFFSPFTYLFWSVLHVLQTAWLRAASVRARTDRLSHT